MTYKNKTLLKLGEVRCAECCKRHPNWSDDIYSSWLKYIEGYDTKTSMNHILRYQYKKHPCYKKIADVRKRQFKHSNKTTNMSPTENPWLLGLYYADGYKKNNYILEFALSMHEEIIVNRLITGLRKLVEKNVPVLKKNEGNVFLIKIYCIELHDKFPNKKDINEFVNLWRRYNTKEKMEFIAGFIDGDGSCSFDVGIDSLQIYSKTVPFIPKYFYNFLIRYGYASLKDNSYRIYLSKEIGSILKPLTMKKDIKRPYKGSVNVDVALKLLKQKISICKISKKFGLCKKTVHLALKQVYGRDIIKKYTDKTKIANNPLYFKERLNTYYHMLRNGENLNSIAKRYELHHNHLKKKLICLFGERKIIKHIRGKNVIG